MDDWGTDYSGGGQWPGSGGEQWPGSGGEQWPGGGGGNQWPGGSGGRTGGGGRYGGGAPGRRRFYLSLLIYALVASVLGAFIGQSIYGTMYDSSRSNVLMVGLVLGIIAGLILLACAICELHRPRITVNHELNLRRVLCGLLVAVAVFAVGCLCEFLYELNSARTIIEFDDMVFAIDDSGSMSTTDPSDLRYSALADLLSTLDDDKRVGLVHFTAEIYTQPIELDELDGDQRALLNESIASPRSDGNTNIYNALQTSLEMIRSRQQQGRYPVVVLLSDGQSPIPFDEVARDYLDAGVAITTVSLGGDTDEATLERLSESTGGQHLTVQQAGDLAAAFQKVSTVQAHRCLFSPRPGAQRGSILYAFLRILFLALPGVLIGLFILWLLDSGSASLQLLVSAMAGLLSGVVMELGTRFFLPLAVVHIVSWALYGVVILSYNEIVNSVRAGKFDVIDYGSTGWDDIPTSELDRQKGPDGESGVIDRKEEWRQ